MTSPKIGLGPEMHNELQRLIGLWDEHSQGTFSLKPGMHPANGRSPRRAGTRSAAAPVSRAPARHELYRGDWTAIARSDVFDGPVESFRFYLLTLTVPSFGQLHRVPRSETSTVPRCACGAVHTLADAGLRGVPLDPSSYDYDGQVAWNRDSGLLWDRTRRRRLKFSVRQRARRLRPRGSPASSSAGVRNGTARRSVRTAKAPGQSGISPRR